MYQEVLSFWFEQLSPEMWWTKDEKLDATIKEKFADVHQSAAQGELFKWRQSALGSLAEIIILDQFSRNMFRDSGQAFAQDPLALVLAQTAIDKAFDLELTPTERSFLYLPFMHSESKLIHQQAVHLYTQLGQANNLDFELKHQAIIEQFGRYPHRNAVLGRTSTAEELVFLRGPNSSF